MERILALVQKALHLAAESAGAKVLLSTDDRFVKRVTRGDGQPRVPAPATTLTTASNDTRTYRLIRSLSPFATAGIDSSRAELRSASPGALNWRRWQSGRFVIGRPPVGNRFSLARSSRAAVPESLSTDRNRASACLIARWRPRRPGSGPTALPTVTTCLYCANSVH